MIRTTTPQRLVLILVFVLVGAASAEPPAKPKHTNRLAKESSPYLLQHAHNPVDWYPWGPEAFAKARKEGKLIFLSIGYSSCHWCHVMEKESFEKEDVAKLLDAGFVCIKVDREERPDIDHIYMTALQTMEQRGGWPLSMFMTADGKPILGGTYWPREDKMVEGQTMRGFKSIVSMLHEVHVKNKDDIAKKSEQLAAATRRALAGAPRLGTVELDRSLVDASVESLKQRFDPRYAGFGSPTRQFQGTKFPMPPNLDLLLTEGERTHSKELTDMVDRTLESMARGGIYDQLGGGFHRYSTERTWTVPHFEKMLYDNAQLVELYARAYRRAKNPLYRRIVAETLAFIERELSAPEGGFYSALDADSEGEEGRFYIWTARELREALADDAGLFRTAYGIDGTANFEGKYLIPLRPAEPGLKLAPAELEAKLAPLRKKLLAIRDARPRPFRDTKALAAWNGQMIAAYAQAGKEFGEPKYLARAARAAEFLLKHMRTPEGKLLRSFAAQPGQPGAAKLPGYLDDYAYVVHGLLILHEAGGDKRWLAEARALTEIMIRGFKDAENGGFFFTSADHEQLFVRSRDQFDGAQPSGNSVAASNLVRLWQLTAEERYHVLARKSFRTFASSLKEDPGSMNTLATALSRCLEAEAKPEKK